MPKEGSVRDDARGLSFLISRGVYSRLFALAFLGRVTSCLSRLLVAISILFFSLSAAADELDAGEAHSLSLSHDLIIVDIRRASEWRKTGMPATSHGISLQNFLKKVRKDFTKDIMNLVDGDLQRPIALICATGGRSAYASGMLREAGFSQVYNIGEGMLGNGALPGWVARNLPIRECDNC